MNIHEYQSKEIFAKYGIIVPKGYLFLTKQEIDGVIDSIPESKVYVVKAQVHAGGRGKAGGIKVAKSKAECKVIAHEMFGSKLITKQTGADGKVIKKLYIEQGVDIAHEYYLSMIFDRSISRISIIISDAGGMDIEEVAKTTPEKITKISIDPAIGIAPFYLRKLAYSLVLKDEQAKELMKIIAQLYQIFIENDASQIEINPLVLDSLGKWYALDAKMSFDENALYRRPQILAMRDLSEENEQEIAAQEHDISYVKMDGNIGCMVNGAGLAMASMDIIKLHGAEPANFLDVGGGSDKKRVLQALKIILSDRAVKGILVNIFGGIMHCDIIAEAIVDAVKEIGIKIPMVVRLAGTNYEKGKEILANSNLAIIAADNLEDAAQKIVNAIKN